MDVLLIEDNDYRRVTILKYLLRRGYRVTPCSSVSEAEEILRFVSPSEIPADVVIAARELMGEGGDNLHRVLRGYVPEIRWILLPPDRGVAWLADRLAHPEDDEVLAHDYTDPRLNILIIEPDDRRRSAMIARLADRGDRITACRRVGDAMTVLAALTNPDHAPDAIVSDVHLGDGDGLSFYLAASRRFPDVRWIVTTPPHFLPAIA
jgi:DNA-binding NarL/FixJ family response regulator